MTQRSTDGGARRVMVAAAALVLGVAIAGPSGCKSGSGGTAAGGASGAGIGGTNATGGTSQTGGVTGTAGTNAGGSPVGGATAMGGAAGAVPTGGATTSGGTNGSGGATGTGGANGGTDGSGGATGTAGASGAWTPVRCWAAPPSCLGLSHTCGPNGDGDCCESDLVPGGTYLRDNYNLPVYEATVDSYCLDKYEITLGRFRQFVAAYPGSLPAAGAGKNPNNPADPGWDPAWTASLPAAQSDLQNALVGRSCNPFRVWSTQPGRYESLPMGCVDWFTLYAFCAWDGGWLPTRVELDYAARGGAQQRIYPWSNPPSDTTIDGTYATYDCHDASDGPPGCNSIIYIYPVGAKPKGDGLFGHSDLLGNVMEWAQDWFDNTPQSPCVDCADLTPGTYRTLVGGSAISYAANLPGTHDTTSYVPNEIWTYIGARCARMP